jgi:tRNA-2-methylthio-N6-dimethylallyladenosine synthase
MENQIPEKLKNERFQILNKLQQEISHTLNQEVIGQEVEVLVTARDSDKSEKVSGRTGDFRLVHLNPGSLPAGKARPGDFVKTIITKATPNFVIAEGEPVSIRTTRAAELQAKAESSHKGQPVMLGLPTMQELQAQEAKFKNYAK